MTLVHLISQVMTFISVFLWPEESRLDEIACLVCVALSYALFYKAYVAVIQMRANVEFLMATAMLGSLAQGGFREAASVGVIVT